MMNSVREGGNSAQLYCADSLPRLVCLCVCVRVSECVDKNTKYCKTSDGDGEVTSIETYNCHGCPHMVLKWWVVTQRKL